jgi:hypothetical protein
MYQNTPTKNTTKTDHEFPQQMETEYWFHITQATDSEL